MLSIREQATIIVTVGVNLAEQGDPCKKYIVEGFRDLACGISGRMKGKKYKRSETFMKTVFEKGFGLRQPYQIIVDAEFCRELLKCKIVAKEVLPEVLGGPVKILASGCVFDELRRLDEAGVDGITGSLFIAKRFEVLRACRHRPSISACDCIAEIIGPDNKFHLAVAVQNYELRKRLRDVLGVPLLFINRGILLMEEPTKAAIKAAHDRELQKLKPQQFELKAIAKTLGLDEKKKEKKEEGEDGKEEDKKKKKKKKGPKQPNPLSVKRAKVEKSREIAAAAAAEASKPKRKRRGKKASSPASA